MFNIFKKRFFYRQLTDTTLPTSVWPVFYGIPFVLLAIQNGIITSTHPYALLSTYMGTDHSNHSYIFNYVPMAEFSLLLLDVLLSPFAETADHTLDTVSYLFWVYKEELNVLFNWIFYTVTIPLGLLLRLMHKFDLFFIFEDVLSRDTFLSIISRLDYAYQVQLDDSFLRVPTVVLDPLFNLAYGHLNSCTPHQNLTNDLFLSPMMSAELSSTYLQKPTCYVRNPSTSPDLLFWSAPQLVSTFDSTSVLVLLLSVSWLGAVNSNNNNTSFALSLTSLVLVCVIVASSGAETLTYFIFISELSALYLIFITTLSRKARSKPFKTALLSLLPVAITLLWSDKQNHYFTLNLSSYTPLTSFNDFKTALVAVLYNRNLIILIVYLVTLLSAVLLLTTKKSKSGLCPHTPLNKTKQNLFSLDNGLVGKFKNF